MASVRSAVVRGVHNIDHRELNESRHTYVLLSPLLRFGGKGVNLERYPPGFVAFDQYKSLLVDAEGKLSGPRTVLAGFGAGVTESLLAVTPTESIKTTL